MAERKNDLGSTVEALFKGLDGFLSSKTVVGEPVKVGDDILLPLSDVSFGIGAGAFAGSQKDNGGGGMGAKMSPSAILQISKDGTTRLISLKSQDAVSKILDMAPDLVARFTNRGKKKNEKTDEEIIADFEANS